MELRTLYQILDENVEISPTVPEGFQIQVPGVALTKH